MPQASRETRSLRNLLHLPRVSRLAAGLFAFAVFNAIAVDLLLIYTPGIDQRNTALHYAEAYFRGISRDDSWRPMRAALADLDAGHDSGLYQRVLFEQGTKFQYAPTSLIVLEPLRRFPGASLIDDDFLNEVSSVAVAGTALIATFLLVTTARRRGLLQPEDGSPELTLLALSALLLSLTFYPLLRASYLGQIQTWIDLLFAGVLWAWIAGRRATAGALAGAICLLKPNLALLLVWALLRRQWRFAAGWAAVVSSLGLVSLGLYGFWNHWEYLEVLSFISRHGESYFPNQSVNGLLHRMFSNGNNLHWEGSAFAPYHPGVYWATLLSSALLVAGALFWRRGEAERSQVVDLCLASFSFTLASPIVWEHHYGVALPMFAVVLPIAWALPRKKLWPLAWLAAAYFLISNDLRIANRSAHTGWNFLQSYLFAGGLVFLALLYRLRAAATPL